MVGKLECGPDLLYLPRGLAIPELDELISYIDEFEATEALDDLLMAFRGHSTRAHQADPANAADIGLRKLSLLKNTVPGPALLGEPLRGGTADRLTSARGTVLHLPDADRVIRVRGLSSSLRAAGR